MPSIELNSRIGNSITLAESHTNNTNFMESKKNDQEASSSESKDLLKSIQNKTSYTKLREQLEWFEILAITTVLIREIYIIIISMKAIPSYNQGIAPLSILFGGIAYLLIWIIIIRIFKGLSFAFLDMVDITLSRHGSEQDKGSPLQRP